MGDENVTYKEFLERKIDIAPLSGIEIDPAEVNPVLKDHQRVSVPVGAARRSAQHLCPLRSGQDGHAAGNGAESFRSTREARHSL